MTDTATASALGLALATGGGGSTTTPTSTTSTTSTTTTSTTVAGSSTTTSSTTTTTSDPDPPDDPPPEDPLPVTIPLKPGNRNAAVKVLQQALTDAGYSTPVTGTFASITTKNLRAFKKANGLPVTSTLTVAAAELLGLTPVPKVPTRYGERGEHVLLLQQALRAEGYQIAADGRFGPGTRTALRSHQRVAGVKVTGALDAKTAPTFGW